MSPTGQHKVILGESFGSPRGDPEYHQVTIKSQIINAVATAALLGVGSTVLGLKINDARQDDRITRLETLNDNVNQLSSDLSRVDKHLSQIDGRFQGEQDGPRH